MSIEGIKKLNQKVKKYLKELTKISGFNLQPELNLVSGVHHKRKKLIKISPKKYTI